ncbi:MAG: cobalamin-independent methionine synthase II family protein [Alphaproteobacteria bacterium]
MADRILTTHAGSLPRPAALVDLYVRRGKGEAISGDELTAAASAATKHVVEKQHEVGIDIPNDGEQIREAFFLYVQRRMSGFGGRWSRKPFVDLFKYPQYGAWRRAMAANAAAVSNMDPPMAIGEVKYTAPEENEAEIADFKAALDAVGGDFADTFITAPSPGIVATAMKNDFYPSLDAYLDALADAIKVEYDAAARHGLLLQIDAPDLAMERHMWFGDEPLDTFLDFVEKTIAAINRALADVPRERARLHVCWGNYEGPHDSDVALKEILPILLKCDVGGFLLPFGNPRHQHEPKVFKDIKLAPDQYLIAGVIDTQTIYVEHPEVVAERLEKVAEAVGDPGRVQAGTDCGFDTSAGMGKVTEDVVWAKLRAMCEGAELASKRLF